MSLKIIGLQSLLKALDKETVQEILNNFKSIPNVVTGEVNDVEYFLHSKAIHFEKMTISTTHLIFSEYKGNDVLVGYFSVANKPLTMSKRNYNNLSSSQKRKLCQGGRKTESGGYVLNSYLRGQIGKNYSKEALETKSITGKMILSLAYDTLLQAKMIVNAKYVWLECTDNPKLLNFYKSFGFTEINNYTSENKLKLLIMKLEDQKFN